MDVESPGGPLSDDEVRQMHVLLARYVAHDLDQWEMWSIATPPYGSVYVRLNRGPFPDGHDEEWYVPIWPPVPRPKK